MKTKLLSLILISVLICACGENTASSENSQSISASNNGLSTNGDVIAESQATRQNLKESIEQAQAVLNSLEGREESDHTGKYLSSYNASDEQEEYEESLKQQDNTEISASNDNTNQESADIDYEKDAKVDSNARLPEIPSNTGKYTAVTVDQLNRELEENAMRAENSWNDKNVVMAGYLDNIDNDGMYFTILGEDKWGAVTCRLNKNEEVRNIIMNQSTGDAIVVYGKISSIGEVIGYTVDVDKVEGTATSTAKSDASTAMNGKYKVVTVGDLINDLESNAMRAESTWKDKYVQVTGYLYNIDSDGSFFNITDAPNEYHSINIRMGKSESVKNVIMNKNIGDKVVVKGKITGVGEILGISVDAESVE